MATKFYVYGGGRWREIDLNTGRVSGWAASARLLVARRGRLECARAAPVLRALRSLAAGEPSRASDGPRLPHASWVKEDRKLNHASSTSSCGHCCQHRRHKAVENGCGHAPTVPPLPPPVAPMAAPPAPASLPAPPAPAQLSTRTSQTIDKMFEKLKNEGLQNPDTSSSRVVKHSPHKRVKPQIRKRQRSSTGDSETVLISNTVTKMKDTGHVHGHNKPNKLRSRPVRRSSVSMLGSITIANPKSDLEIKPQVKNIIVKKSSVRVRNKKTPQHKRDAMRRVPMSTNNANQNIESIEVDENHKTTSISESKGNKEDINLNNFGQLTKDGNAAFAYALHSGGRTAASGHVTWTTPPGTSELCKELVIDEDDVAVLRTFLLRNAPEVSLRRFDYDDEYKRGIFYRLNPLVIVERSERVREMLGADELSLRDFASQLGLRSVSDKSVRRNGHSNGAITKSRRKLKQPDRFSVQASTQPNKSPVTKQVQSSKSSPKKKEVSKKLESDNNSAKRSPQKRPVSPPPVPPPRQKAEPKQPKVMSVQTKNLGKKSGGVKEYSRAEDSAIVTWISNGGRARLVNGNRVWHELQDQFERLTGHGRTWQSLRNRYLRYILPTLSSLAVPPDRAARLRADAAAGELKRARWQTRRNSIFATPGVRGAWSRRPREPPRAPTHSPPETRAPSSHSPSPVQQRDTDNTSSSSEATSRRASSTQKSKRARSSSSERPALKVRSSSENARRSTRLSLVKRSQPTRPSRRNSESRKQVKEARPSFSGKENHVRRSSSSEMPTRATRSSLRRVNRSRVLSSSDNPSVVSISSTAKRMRRSSSSEKQTRATRSSFGKGKQARRSLSSENQSPVSISSSSEKSTRVRRSSSSSSSSSVLLPSKRGNAFRYSEVTRRFARKQKARQVEDSTSPTKSQSPLPAPKGSRSRRLFNPKAAL